MEGKTPSKRTKDDSNANLDIYTTMANYVAQILHIRPAEILDTWGVPELLVTYGVYANEEAKKNFKEWESLDKQQRNKISRPPEILVYFHDYDIGALNGIS